ncbi:uncharacterized protein LOC108680144 [Hyalella azteca]|uniref:Glycosyltransferase family 92 protein n=1 Tax=Hyalella azteca TaxID=294128 RepID=A0A8B7PEH1_HYAAZ|nr:uncharacterized protein LOC108680144 [Hyalella azteca]
MILILKSNYSMMVKICFYVLPFIVLVTIAHYIFYSSTQFFISNVSPLKQCPCPILEADPASFFAKDELSRKDPKGLGSSYESLAAHHPNAPLRLLNSSFPRCSLMPEFMKIHWTASVWQHFKDASGKKFLLYSAIYENRTKTEPPGGVVRVVTLLQKEYFDSFELPWCLLWYNHATQPYISRVIRAEYIDWQWESSDRLLSYMLTCPALQHAAAPWGASVVSQPCTPAQNLLSVVSRETDQTSGGYKHGRSAGSHSSNQLISGSNGRPQRERLASGDEFEVGVCGPALFYYQEDFSVRLVEWLELLRALGTSQVFLYVTRVHPNIEKVLRYYEQKGFVHTTDFHYPPPYVDEPLLRRTKDWPIPPPSYWFRWQYFPSDLPPSHEHASSQVEGYTLVSPSGDMRQAHDYKERQGDVPAYLHMLYHDQKLINDPDEKHYNFKSLYDMADTTAAFSHRSVACASGPCSQSQQIDLSVAYVGHFSGQCGERCMRDPHATATETALHKFRDNVAPRVIDVLKKLSLIPPSPHP